MLQTVTGRCILFLFFLICGILDLKDREIDLRIFLVMGLTELLWFFWHLTVPESDVLLSAKDTLTGLLPGAVLLAASFLTRGSIGTGDGLFFLLAGAASGLWPTLSFLSFALLFAAVFSLVLLTRGMLTGRAAGGLRIPFLPFTVPPLIFWFLSSQGTAGGLF